MATSFRSRIPISIPKKLQDCFPNRTRISHHITEYNKELTWKIYKVSHMYPPDADTVSFIPAFAQRLESKIYKVNVGSFKTEWQLKILLKVTRNEATDAEEMTFHSVISSNLLPSATGSYGSSLEGRTVFHLLDSDKQSALERNCPVISYSMSKNVLSSKTGVELISYKEFWDEQGTLFPEDKLRIRVNLTLWASDDGIDRSSPTGSTWHLLENLPGNLSSNMLGLLRSGRNADVTIQCDGEKFLAHKSILGARSPVFATMFDCGLEESQSNYVNVRDIQPDVFRRLLEYIYGSIFAIDELEDLDKLIGLTKASEKYQLVELKALCFQLLVSTMTLDSFGDVAVMAYLYSADDSVKKKVFEFHTKHCSELLETQRVQILMKDVPGAFLPGLDISCSSHKSAY